MRDLTIPERRVLLDLGSTARQAADLPVLHNSDLREFVSAIHKAQNIILARPAYEAQSDAFLQKERL
jgi:hypothetical protein